MDVLRQKKFNSKENYWKFDFVSRNCQKNKQQILRNRQNWGKKMQKIRKREVFELKKRPNWGKKIGKHFFFKV